MVRGMSGNGAAGSKRLQKERTCYGTASWRCILHGGTVHSWQKITIDTEPSEALNRKRKDTYTPVRKGMLSHFQYSSWLWQTFTIVPEPGHELKLHSTATSPAWKRLRPIWQNGLRAASARLCRVTQLLNSRWVLSTLPSWTNFDSTGILYISLCLTISLYFTVSLLCQTHDFTHLHMKQKALDRESSKCGINVAPLCASPGLSIQTPISFWVSLKQFIYHPKNSNLIFEGWKISVVVLYGPLKFITPEKWSTNFRLPRCPTLRLRLRQVLRCALRLAGPRRKLSRRGVGYRGRNLAATSWYGENWWKSHSL